MNINFIQDRYTHKIEDCHENFGFKVEYHANENPLTNSEKKQDFYIKNN